MNTTAREALARLMLDEHDALLKRLEHERAAWPELIEATRVKVTEEVKAAAVEELGKRAREHWSAVGAIASKAATNAAVAALAAHPPGTNKPTSKLIIFAAAAFGGAFGAALTVLLIRLATGL
jgi:hypothetical protein